MTFIYKTSTYQNSAYMSMPCICMYVHCTYMCMILISVILHRPDGLKSKIPLVGFASTSIFSSPPESNLLRILHPPYLYLMDLNSPQSGWSTYTGLLILSCVGFQPNWQSGLVKTCRMSWAFPTKLIRGQSLAVVGPLQS